MKYLEFHIVDYVIMVIFLAISSLIGIYYGFYKKQRTTEEYILGNRQIHLVPVALSLAVTFQSAVSIIGYPSEIYLYNIMAFYMTIGLCIVYLLQAFFIVPLVHPLRLTSAYEYLQRRFKSRAVQLLAMTIGMLQTLLYVSIVLYSPALALEAVAGIPIWLSIVLIGIFGTFYTAIGGMRSVVWTDTFQFVMIYGGLTVVLVLSVQEIGSLSKVFELSSNGDRIKFDEFNPDPRVRHTVWGCVIGGVFNNLPNYSSQSSIQRISSIAKAKDAKITLSSGINSMATNALQDVMTGYSKEATQVKKTFMLKFLVLVFGILTVALAYLSQYLTGPVTQMTNTAFGASGGPVAGIFFLGSVFPRANGKGALAGGISGIAINMWIALGSFLYGNKAPLSKPITTSGCIKNETDQYVLNVTMPSEISTFGLSVDRYSTETTTVDIIKYQQSMDDNHIVLYDLSYVWLGLIGFLIAVIVGLAVSFITGKDKEHPTEPMFIIPFLRRLWTFDDSTLHGNLNPEYSLVSFDQEIDVVGTKRKTQENQ